GTGADPPAPRHGRRPAVGEWGMPSRSLSLSLSYRLLWQGLQCMQLSTARRAITSRHLVALRPQVAAIAHLLEQRSSSRPGAQWSISAVHQTLNLGVRTGP